jgi:hypothetical protein
MQQLFLYCHDSKASPGNPVSANNQVLPSVTRSLSGYARELVNASAAGHFKSD